MTQYPLHRKDVGGEEVIAERTEGQKRPNVGTDRDIDSDEDGERR